MEEFTPKKCCIKCDPPTLVLFYELNDTGKIHRRSIPLRDLEENSTVENIVDLLLKKSHHSKYLQKVPREQVERIVKKLLDKIYPQRNIKLDGTGMTLMAEKNEEINAVVNGNLNLNKLGDEELNEVKKKMDETFEENKIKPGDENWQYDVEVNFDNKVNKIESGWDSEESEMEF